MKPVVVIPTYNERENVEAMAATSLKNVAAISLAPKMIMKLRQDVKALKQDVAKLSEMQ